MWYIKRKSDGAYVSLEESTDTKASHILYWKVKGIPSTTPSFNTQLEAERRVVWWKVCRYLKDEVEIVWEGDSEEPGEDV